MFFNVKRDERVKRQTCADFRKQCKKVVPGDATPPTVSTESVLITETIYAHEGYAVWVWNIPGEFLSADMDKDVKLPVCGGLVELMVIIVPQIYRHHVIYEKVRLLLYVTLKKKLYSFLK